LTWNFQVVKPTCWAQIFIACAREVINDHRNRNALLAREVIE
jgi:hypothetical protein